MKWWALSGQQTIHQAQLTKARSVQFKGLEWFNHFHFWTLCPNSLNLEPSHPNKDPPLLFLHPPPPGSIWLQITISSRIRRRFTRVWRLRSCTCAPPPKFYKEIHVSENSPWVVHWTHQEDPHDLTIEFPDQKSWDTCTWGKKDGFSRLLGIATILFSNEGALRRPLTYDNHPSHFNPIHPHLYWTAE